MLMPQVTTLDTAATTAVTLEWMRVRVFLSSDMGKGHNLTFSQNRSRASNIVVVSVRSANKKSGLYWFSVWVE